MICHRATIWNFDMCDLSKESALAVPLGGNLSSGTRTIALEEGKPTKLGRQSLGRVERRQICTDACG